MGMNKAQRQAAARAKQEAMDAQPVVEAAVTEQPKVEPKPTATPATQAVSKQQLTVMRLTVALREQRQIELKPEQLTQDGKYILINVGAAWPVMRIGTNGGVSLPAIRSYKEGMDTWMKADELLAKQTARDAKKQTAAATPAPAVKAVA